jgi:multicomponent Na+:H+ antiporter subunit G
MNAPLTAWLASGLLVSGALLCLVGAVGVLRFPDAFSRMHAASKAGALGAALTLAGVVAATSGESALEALFALVVVLASAPLAAHAVARAARRAGVMPYVGAVGDEEVEPNEPGAGGNDGGRCGGAEPPRDQSARREPPAERS